MKNSELMIIRQVAMIFKLLHDARKVDYFIVENVNRIGLDIKGGEGSLRAVGACRVGRFHKRRVGFFHSGSDASRYFVNSINHFFRSVTHRLFKIFGDT
jgi:hypothetical protein